MAFVYVPGVTAVETKLIVGFPVDPSPLATEMLPDVPAIDRALTVPPLTPTSPVDPDIDWKLERNAPRPIKGFADTPSPLAMVRPVPAVIERAVSVPRAVLTCMPLPLEFKLDAAPVKLICMVPCAPPSMI